MGSWEVVYDQDTAERQVDLVQKAQRLTERRITPLRLNLPLRGRHYVFVTLLKWKRANP
jgi:3,4-dihydroxy-2-butanone 4-phosphate synthase